MSDPIAAEADRLSVKTQRISYYLFAALMAAVLFGPGGGGSGQRLVEDLAEGATAGAGQ